MITMEQKSKTSEQLKQRSNDVDPDRFATTLTAIFVLSEATTQSKGARYLAYDSYDARFCSILTWPR